MTCFMDSWQYGIIEVSTLYYNRAADSWGSVAAARNAMQLFKSNSLKSDDNKLALSMVSSELPIMRL